MVYSAVGLCTACRRPERKLESCHVFLDHRPLAYTQFSNLIFIFLHLPNNHSWSTWYSLSSPHRPTYVTHFNLPFTPRMMKLSRFLSSADAIYFVLLVNLFLGAFVLIISFMTRVSLSFSYIFHFHILPNLASLFSFTFISF